MNERFARTPRPPYYAAIFTSQHKNIDHEGYRHASLRMLQLARDVPGSWAWRRCASRKASG